MKTSSLLVTLALAFSAPAFAEADVFGLGNGHDNSLTIAADAGTIVLGSCAPVTALDGGSQVLFGAVQAGTIGFTSGGLVLISRSTGLSSFTSGDQTAIDVSASPVGRYELARVQTATAGALTFTAPLVNASAFGSQTQIVAVPELTSLTIGTQSTLSAPGWNGACGGVLALLVNGTMTLNGTAAIDASALGFRGGLFINQSNGSNGCTSLDGADAGAESEDARKGEGLVPARFGGFGIGRGNITNGAGGGNCHNAGGGGGAHGGRGGIGGNSFDGNRAVGGLGGAALSYSLLQQLLFGGGGGAASGNNNVGTSGGRGGGFVLARASALAGTGFVRANGASAANTTANDAAGGGGAGGAISLRITGNAACGGVQAIGGNGGNVSATSHGPGGGGAGGRILFQASTTTGGCALSVASGVAGTDSNNSVYGAGPTSSSDPTTLGTVTTLPGGLTLPVVAITSPVNGGYANTNPPVISGTASPGAAVTVRIGGSTVCAATATIGGTWACTPALTLAEGLTTASATATFQSLTSGVATSTFTIDSIAPAVSLTTPVADASFATTTPTFTGTAEAGSTVRVVVDGNDVCTTTASLTGGWSCIASSPLAQGAHVAVAVATDAANNAAQTTPARPFVIDTVAPAAPFIDAPSESQVVGSATPTFSGRAEAGSTVQVRVDGNPVCAAVTSSGGTWSCVSSVTLGQGAREATATASDAAGNGSLVSDTRHFSIDSVGPGLPTLTAPTPGALLSDTTPTFAGTAEPNSTVVITIDGSTTCTTTASASGDYTCTPTSPLAEGAHLATATAFDAVNNPSPVTAPVSFTIDASAPTAPVLATPANGSSSTNTLPTFTGTAEASSAITVRVDGAVVCTTVATVLGSFGCTASAALADGLHVAVATSTDPAGNTSLGSNVNSFRVDTSAPFTPSILVPSAGASTSATPVLSGLSEPGSTVTVLIDGATACTATASAQGAWACAPSTPLSTGAHSATASAVDAAGNASAVSNAVSFTVAPNQTPSTPVITSPSAGSVTDEARPTFSGVAEPGSAVTVFVDGASLCTATTDAQGHFSCLAAAALSDGTHTATASSTGSGTSSPVSFTVDTQAPNAPTIVVPAANATTDATPTFSGQAEAGSTVSVSVDGMLVCTAVANAQGAYSCLAAAPLSTGSHIANATATDRAGNVSGESADTGFTVAANEAPSTPVVTGPANGTTTNDSTPTFSGLGAPSSTVAVSVDGMVVCSAVVNAQGQWACTAATAIGDGAHEITASATNTNGTSPSSNAVDFTIDTLAPNVPVVATPSVGATTSPSPALTGTAEANSTVTVRVDGVVVCLVTASSAGEWSCVVGTTLINGPHQATATATDAAGNTSAESGAHGFVVSNGFSPSAPTLTTPVNGSSGRDTTPTFSGMAEPNSTVSVRVDGALVCTTTASVQGAYSCDATAALADGAHSATASASNVNGSSGNSNASTFTVDSTAPMTPVLVAPSEGGVVTAGPTFSGTGEPGSTVEVKVDGAVACTATVNAQGAWSCDATVQPGEHQATVTATDAVGNVSAASSNRTFTVASESGSAPVITAPTAGSTVAGPAVTISGTGATPRAAVTVTDASGATVCTTVGGVDGAWQCEATLAAGAHTVTATSAERSSNAVTFTVTIAKTAQRLVGGGCGCDSASSGLGVLLVLLPFMRRRKNPTP